jgi:hypothetical protein
MTNENYFNAKADKGKIRAGLVLQDFANALKEVSKVSTFGAQKYAAHSWLNVPDAKERYLDAGARHYLEFLAGREKDGETGFLHLAHFAWNVLAVLELELRDEDIENQKAN